MYIKEITIERSLTINLGNFESARFTGSMTAHLTEDDNPDDAYEALGDMLMEKLQADIQAFGE